MMYKSNLAVAIKSNGKVLREFNDQVFIPFGAEYSLYFKNLNNTRAVVKVSVDGKNVTNNGIIVESNSSVDLERSIANGNLLSGNRFKFIERTANVEKHRGVGIEDGLIRIEFQFEKPAVKPTLYRGGPDFYNRGITKGISGSLGQSNSWGSSTCDASYADSSPVNKSLSSIQCSSARGITAQSFVNQAGVTVAGSVSNQNFVKVEVGEMEYETHVIMLQLLSETEGGTPIPVAVTVKAKPECTSCGKINKATAKFCSECGTSLVIV